MNQFSITESPAGKYKRPIIFFGDSITECMPIENLFPNIYCLNRGIGGDFTYGILSRIERDIIAENPMKVFVLIGTNDLSWPDRDIGKITGNIEKTILEILNKVPDVKIYLESILPIYPNGNSDNMDGRKNIDIDATNSILSNIAEKLKITYIDINLLFRDSSNELRKEMSYDGLHLNDEGYLKLAQILTPFINE